MFFRRRNPLMSFLILLLGLNFLKRNQYSEAEKQTYRAKRRLFRSKLHEAFSVWDEPSVQPNAEPSTASTTVDES